MPWPCFLIRPLGRDRIYLRRYSDSAKEKCPATGGAHDARAFARDADVAVTEPIKENDQRALDPRWPTKCDRCDYVFLPADHRQLFAQGLYCADDGRVTTLRDAPVGAIWHAEWLDDHWPGPDGKSLVVKLAGGHDWCIDGPASDGGRWTRTGEPPRLTVSPSIAVPGYHGFLKDGLLTDPLRALRERP